MKTLGEWLEDPSLFATSAIVILTDRWGVEFMEWDPITVGLEIQNEFGVEPSSELQDKIQSACSLFTSNLFFVSIEAFNATCNALNFGDVASELFVPADLDDVLWGVTEARILLGDDFEEDEFSHDVKRYIGLLMAKAGYKRPPSVLAFAEYDEEEDLNLTESFDDEILHQVYWESQDQDKQRLEGDNNLQIMLLFRQISQIPVKHGSTQSIRETLMDVKAQMDLPEPTVEP